MNEYTITIKKQGKLEKTVRGIVAATAIIAINFVEEMLGDKSPEMHIDASTGAMCVFGWSGREYVARKTSY